MDTSFDLVALLKQQPSTKSHKIKPTQFVSVAGGVQKRLETTIKNRKSSRLSFFDRIRNIAKCESPKASALSEAQQKALYRKQQLEKWKEERDKKKKEAASQKKKPFVAGMSKRNTFGPPPPPRPLPSTSGRVTRSQLRRQLGPEPSNTQTKSFAPRNATFKPSLSLKSDNVPKLAPVKKKEASKSKPTITFDPVLPKKIQKETRSTLAATRAKSVVETKTRKPNDKTKVNVKTMNTIQESPPHKQQMSQNSLSSSDTEDPKPPQESTSHDSVCVLQDACTSAPDTVSMSSQESISQDTASMSSDACDAHDASMSQDTASSQDELSTPKIKAPKSESSSEEKLRSPKLVGGLTPEQIIDEAKNISPCVTMSRGKSNAREEMKKKLDEGLLDEDSSNINSLNHFRQQLNSEIVRITAMCDIWDQIFAQTVLPENVQELVLTAVGQARLLMSKKLQQFAGLIEQCADPTPGTKLITPADLQGFWDMVFMQVENVDVRFKNLEELRLRDWIEEQKPQPKKVVPKPAKNAVVKPSGGPSRLREMIAAARKAKKVQESQSENSESEKSEARASPQTKTFDAGFFRVCSPLRRGSPAAATPKNKTSLHKSVLSSEAKKSVCKNATSFAMLRASLMSKNVDIEGVSPLTLTPTIAPVNLFATPARSILKQNHPDSTKKTEKTKTVLFYDSDEASSPTSYTSCDKTVSEVPPLPADDKENNETPRKKATLRKPRLSRQDAADRPSPVMTRSRRKSAQTPLIEADSNVEVKNHSTRKSREVQEVDSNVEVKNRSTRKSREVQEADSNVEVKNRSTRKSREVQEADSNVEVKKRSTRKSQVQEVETPKRSTRRRKSAV